MVCKALAKTAKAYDNDSFGLTYFQIILMHPMQIKKKGIILLNFII